jgi:hypothetical protein
LFSGIAGLWFLIGLRLAITAGTGVDKSCERTDNDIDPV